MSGSAGWRKAWGASTTPYNYDTPTYPTLVYTTCANPYPGYLL